jgi:hypothetical protein
MGEIVQVLRRFTRNLSACLLVAALALAPALASPSGPNGINIGFDFNWYKDGSMAVPTPPGYSATFINTGGTSLSTCLGGTVTSSTIACDFVMTYDIGGVPQTAPITGGAYETLPNPIVGETCTQPKAPLTLWDCFNQNSYGEVFYPQSTGTLSALTVTMTCLNPAGGTLNGLFAVLYQVNPGGESLPATPLAQVPVDLSTCPTLTSWAGHTFSPADFAAIPLNFSNITLVSGTPYGIFFAGPLVPGTPPSGFATPPPAPTLTAWGAIGFAVALLAFGIWKLRRRSAA